ncbi:MAG: histidine kinase [Chitinophagaceae bacterium]
MNKPTNNTGNKRFPFWKICWIILGINAAMVILGMALTNMVGNIIRIDLYSRVSFWIGQVVSIVFYIGFYYLLLNACYNLFATRKKFISFIPVLLLAAAGCAAFLLIFHNLSPDLKESKTKIPLELLAFTYTLSVLFHVGLNLLVAYLVYLRDERKQQKILQEQKIKLEMEKANANLNFLKAQINPHFLHNTLNFLYSKSLPYSAELSEGILTLSEIMRYALNDTNAPNGKTLLKDEIEHVRNVIKINQLRFNNNLQVNFEVNGVINGATIIPFVLITIVENAFKHGFLKDTAYPLEIKLNVNNNRLDFYCRNKKKTGPKELSTGIGLDNIKKRLELAYHDQYSLTIKDEQDLYTTQLTILSL